MRGLSCLLNMCPEITLGSSNERIFCVVVVYLHADTFMQIGRTIFTSSPNDFPDNTLYTCIIMLLFRLKSLETRYFSKEFQYAQ